MWDDGAARPPICDFNTTMRDIITGIPWRIIKQVIWLLRRYVFTTDKGHETTVDVELETCIERLHNQHFEDGWILSYHDIGEDANLRRPEGTLGGYNRQLHIRLWDLDDGRTGIRAHTEASPVQHPKRHLSGWKAFKANDDAKALVEAES